jgi:hypothetical protein
MIGIDVGGANLKIVASDGVHIHYCPLWQGTPLVPLLEQYRHAGERAAVVMSGELADCFTDKQEGIAFIVDAVRQVFPDAIFYGTDAAFHAGPVPALAAANWLAAADWLRETYPSSVLLDVGSTTADIIPLSPFSALKDLTDLRRLQKGYLVYTGVLRTPVATLLSSVRLAGVETPVSTEYFATSADAHLILGHIGVDSYTCEAPDRKEKTMEASRRRLARVVCADIAEIGNAGAVTIAQAFWDRQRALVCGQVHRVLQESGATGVVTAGIGAALFADACGGTDLTKVLGPAADALPAFAVREVARRTRGN